VATASVGFFAKLGGAAKVGLAVLALGGAASGLMLATGPGERSSETPPGAHERPDAPPQSPRAEAVSTPPAAASLEAAAPRDDHEAPAAEASVALGAPRDQPSAPIAAPRPRAVADTMAATGGPSAPLPSEPASRGPAAAPTPTTDPLAEEAALLGRAQSALAAGRNVDALQLLDEHARRFPTGALAPEREGARWLALCGSGRADAVRGTVRAFLERNPSSPLAARLRAACGAGD
jgi:hypothetical protein